MTVGVLLAAGAGSRLGLGPKALLRRPGGQPLVRALARALLAGGCDEVLVVAGAGAQEVSRAVTSVGCHVIVNDDWAAGMSSSFRAGIDKAVELGADSVIIALVDQPGLNERVVAHLLARTVPGRVTAAGYRDADGQLLRGHPLIFPAPLARDAAAGASGDAGARAWLRAHPELLDVHDVGHLASGRDIDTRADFDAWVAGAPR